MALKNTSRKRVGRLIIFAAARISFVSISLTICFVSLTCAVFPKDTPKPAAQKPPQEEAVRKAIERANRLLDRGEIEEALPLYNRIIAEDSTATAAYIGRAKLRLELGKTDEALKDLNLAVKYDRNMSNNAVMERGNLFQVLHRYEEAVKDYSFILAAGASDSVSQERGNCYLHLNKPQLAISDYTQALKRKTGRRVHILTGRGNAYLLIKDYQKALEDYDTVLREDPDANRSQDNYANIHEAKAEIYKRMGKLDLAKKEKEKAWNSKRELMDLAPFTSDKGK